MFFTLCAVMVVWLYSAQWRWFKCRNSRHMSSHLPDCLDGTEEVPLLLPKWLLSGCI